MTGAHTPSVADISLRDWFAGQAMAGLCACNDRVQHAISEVAQDEGITSSQVMAGLAYERADAMLAARATSKEAQGNG